MACPLIRVLDQNYFSLYIGGHVALKIFLKNSKSKRYGQRNRPDVYDGFTRQSNIARPKTTDRLTISIFPIKHISTVLRPI